MNGSNTIKDFQQIIDQWIQEHGGYWPPLSMLASISEEIGEVAREINHLEGFKPKKETEPEGDLGEELADLFFSVICVANYYKIDLDKKIHRILEKYTKRDKNRFKK